MADAGIPRSPTPTQLRLVARAEGPGPSAEGGDPHPAWFAEWRALVDWCNGPDADGDGKMQDDLVT